jgi:hypothetical protein
LAASLSEQTAQSQQGQIGDTLGALRVDGLMNLQFSAQHFFRSVEIAREAVINLPGVFNLSPNFYNE